MMNSMDGTENIKKDIIEESIPGSELMDRAWMASFWEVFTECVIEMDSRYTVTHIIRKTGNAIASKDILGRPFQDFAAEKDRAFVLGELERFKNDGAPPYIRFTSESGTGGYFRWTLMPYFRDGVFCGCRGISVDVTEQTLKEITLNWQRAIIEGSDDFVSITGLDGHMLYANPGAYKMTGYAPESGVLPLERMFTEEYMRAVRAVRHKHVLNSGPWTGLGELTRRDGGIIPIEYTMFCVRDEQDEAILIATVIRDVSVFHEHEKTLEEARKAAESANNAKSEFLSRMSHEIRTPMNAIIGMINIGMSAGDIEKKNYCMKRADSASKHLLGIINDILDMSKIEADKFELSYSTFSFENTLKNISNMANVRAEEKHIDFHVNLAYDVPAFIFCDELRLSQVITNLLTNAIKFTPEAGVVKLNISKADETGDTVTLRFEVSDTGIGISPEQQKRLFSSFNQANSSIPQNFGGTGLGLAISKRIVEMIGGDIWVESELGEGAKFIFTIETKKLDSRQYNDLNGKLDYGNIRILAVDDSEETREYFTHVMDALNLSCDVAAGGCEALSMIGGETENLYDIFFIDWKMPGMNGVELTKIIKDRFGNDAIVIMTSANDWTPVEKEAVAAGVDYFISKPLFPSTIVNAINICIGADLYSNRDGAADADGKPEKVFDFSDRAVMIAEDVDINREIMSAVLSDTGVVIDYAENGEEAVSVFNQNPDKYDLILMDINMPVMNGYDATRRIRALNIQNAGTIPIIAMTANVFKEDIDKCLDSGMNGHIGKPIDPGDLLDRLARYFA